MKKLTDQQKTELLAILKERFENNPQRHSSISWKEVGGKLAEDTEKLSIIHEMEKTGGEPDVVEFENGKIVFVDFSAESPKGRRSFCYDQAALNSRKENKPKNSALKAAQEIGIELLDEVQYRKLQQIEKLDLKTSSWIKTPEDIRKLGGALFCDRRYDAVFTYHNGAESYYAARGFRGFIEL